jgi:hypothetical protein
MRLGLQWGYKKKLGSNSNVQFRPCQEQRLTVFANKMQGSDILQGQDSLFLFILGLGSHVVYDPLHDDGQKTGRVAQGDGRWEKDNGMRWWDERQRI